MKIKLLVARATLNGAESRGDVIDAPEAEAIRMIAAGQAVPVREAVPERAVKATKAERASK